MMITMATVPIFESDDRDNDSTDINGRDIIMTVVIMILVVIMTNR